MYSQRLIGEQPEVGRRFIVDRRFSDYAVQRLGPYRQ